jgi:hypothetical protein
MISWERRILSLKAIKEMKLCIFISLIVANHNIQHAVDERSTYQYQPIISNIYALVGHNYARLFYKL